MERNDALLNQSYLYTNSSLDRLTEHKGKSGNLDRTCKNERNCQTNLQVNPRIPVLYAEAEVRRRERLWHREREEG
jgi:hypothetical protein